MAYQETKGQHDRESGRGYSDGDGGESGNAAAAKARIHRYDRVIKAKQCRCAVPFISPNDEDEWCWKCGLPVDNEET